MGDVKSAGEWDLLITWARSLFRSYNRHREGPLPRLLLLVLIASLCSGSSAVGSCLGNNIEFERWVNHGEPYSVAACEGEDPKAFFNLKMMEWDQTPSESVVIKLGRLLVMAKAALEAGLDQEAKSYAHQALSTAAGDRFQKAPPTSFESGAEGDAVATGNLVLGRLALSHQDVEGAEAYLLASGKAKAGQTTSWGPNMTLALELLKLHRTEALLTFLEECGKFRREGTHPQMNVWAESINKGVIPGFGANLVY